MHMHPGGGPETPHLAATGPSPPLTTHEIAARCRNCVFFAKVPPSVLEPELERLFSRCGTVVGINLYRPWALAKTSKVGTWVDGSTCGLRLVMGSGIRAASCCPAGDCLPALTTARS
jgi:hypothetical protein